MPKSLYEEALADAKQLKELAEANATHALIEAVKPRIKNLLESELMGLDDFGGAEGPGTDPFDLEVETSDSEEVDNAVPAIATNPATQPPRSCRKETTPVTPTTSSVEDTMVSMQEPVNVAAVKGSNATAVVEPTADGAEVALDLDDLSVDPDKEDQDQMYELNLETTDKLSSLKKAGNGKNLMSEKQTLAKINLISESIKTIQSLPSYKRGSRSSQQKIARLIEMTENMYGYVQELLSGSPNKQKLEERLESQFKNLKNLQEKKETDMKKKLVNEEDLTLKLTGLPGMEDEDLENIGVDLVTGDGEEEELDMADDAGAEDAAGDDGGDEDLDFDFGSDEGDDDMGAEDMDENQVIEIDESTIRNEVKRMRRLKEETKPQSWGNGYGKASEDDFGGGKADHEPFEDGHVTTEADESSEDEDQVHEVDTRKGAKKVAEQKASQNGKLRLEQSEIQNKQLRAQLAATNLFNTKLVYTNKLLQLETLTKRQKAAIVERLEETKTTRECKLIYESLMKALSSKKLQESAGAKTRGSASEVLTSSGAPKVISESIETQRWAELAGLTGKNRR